MDTYTMLVIAVFTLLMLIFYYHQYKRYITEKENIKFPPEINACPDYWVHLGGNKCQNKFNLGTCPKDDNGKFIKNGTIDFSSELYQGKDGDFNKCKWTKRCNTTWEGLDNLCG